MTRHSLRSSKLPGRLLRLLMPAIVVVVALLIQLQEPQWRARLRQNSFDELQNRYPASYAAELPLRVVAIDDASLEALGQWPWPRSLLANLVSRLFDLGADVVIFDIFFAEADRTSPQQVAAFWPQNHALQQLLETLPAHDQLLAQSFSHGKVVLGFPLEPVANDTPLPLQRARFLSFGGDARHWLPSFGGGLAALPLLSAGAVGSGAVSLIPDSDGVVRAIPLISRIGTALYPALGLEALRVFLDLDNLAIRVSAPDNQAPGVAAGIQGVEIDSAFVPTASDGRIWLHYRNFHPERYISAEAVLAGRADAAALQGHIVYIGATAKGLGDTIYTPLGEAVPGIEGHLQLSEALLSGDILLPAAWESDLLTLLLLLEWVLLAWMLARLRPIWSVLQAAVVVVTLFVAAGWLFVAQQILFDPLYPALALLLLFLSLALPRYLQTEREQRWISTAFSRYVSPNRVKYLQEHPHQLELGGSYRECSFVMSDLQGFTSLMEKHEPALLSDLINEYLDGMIAIAFRHEGTLDRIVGDAVAVMFSAPVAQPDHAARALACALEMDRFAMAFSQRKQQAGIPFGLTRIGVNTGIVMVGNFGGKAMLDYRALGDAINTAARLETINAKLGTRICVSGATMAQCPHCAARPIGELVLKGKSEAISAFDPLLEVQSQQCNAYLAAYQLMKDESEAAVEAFQTLALNYPNDPLASYHAKRLVAGEKGCRMVMTSK
ncbi:MAG: adenylate/guanylate cyclase domain-containing protein [Gammaproteobacteria bacterium]|nr:adenylate/guanylate cyclase domain-containing protein [Gammaproteobacteria bacterium]